MTAFMLAMSPGPPCSGQPVEKPVPFACGEDHGVAARDEVVVVPPRETVGRRPPLCAGAGPGYSCRVAVRYGLVLMIAGT